MLTPQELFLALLGEGYDLSKATLAYRLSVSAIKNYTRTNRDVEELFPNEVVALAQFIYNKDSNGNLKSISQGSRTLTFSVDEIPVEIKNSLPRYIKVY